MSAGLRWTVSVKGVVLENDGVVLVHNERDEWELPGGCLEDGETPEECVVREIAEEVGLEASADVLLDAWVYEVLPGQKVLILTYACSVEARHDLVVSAEHDDARWVPIDRLDELVMPDGYRSSIRRCAERGHSPG